MAIKDPYQTLGIARTASQKEIKAAFKKLTRKHHPDLNPDDAAAVETFQEISAAYDLLSDPEKRRRFDAGEIDATGAERPQQRFYREYAEGGPRASYHARQDGFATDDDLEDFLSRVFGGRARQSGTREEVRARGQDVHYTMSVSFLEAANGAERTVSLPEGRSLRLSIPEGAHDGQMLRLRGQGLPGYGGGPSGDAYVELKVEPHAFFHRKDDNIHVEVPVTLKEAVLGAKIEVPTISGTVSLTIPKGSNTGKTLRLRNKGIRNPRDGVRGHQYVTLKVVLPDGSEPELEQFLEQWTPARHQNPRKEMLT